MRKLAMLSTAMLGLTFALPSDAQPANSAPQPGLPPGASIGAPNATQPPASGDIATTSTVPPHHVHHVVHHHVHHVVHHVAPATTAPQ